MALSAIAFDAVYFETRLLQPAPYKACRRVGRRRAAWRSMCANQCHQIRLPHVWITFGAKSIKKPRICLTTPRLKTRLGIADQNRCMQVIRDDLGRAARQHV